MKKRDYNDFVFDIFDSIKDIESFWVNMEYCDFLNDKKTRLAVIRSIEIIGEASKNIPKDIKDLYPEIPWKVMAGMRDKMIHEYFGVDYETVFKTAKYRIPELKILIEKILNNFDGWLYNREN
jgi:uncharacterized protein with HEPN domain